MDAGLLIRLERIAAAGIQLLPLPALERHFVLERDGFAVLVERRGDGFGGIGSPGLLSERGFEALVQRGETALFVFKGEERQAEPAEADAARRLLSDVKQALL